METLSEKQIKDLKNLILQGYGNSLTKVEFYFNGKIRNERMTLNEVLDRINFENLKVSFIWVL